MVANPPNEIIPFISDGDLPLVRELREKVSDISIACHELLGHGSGRLFMETSPGVFNFDKNDLPRDPLTQQAIESWYLPGQTWQNMFKSDAGSLEECRADGIALFLSSMPEVLSIFGADEDSAVESDDSTVRPSTSSVKFLMLCSYLCVLGALPVRRSKGVVYMGS